jgi:hypothetical protein
MPKTRPDLGKTSRAKLRTPNRSLSRSNVSAGIFAYRRSERGLEVLLVHPGGPFWRNKEEGACPSRRGKSTWQKIRSKRPAASSPKKKLAR